MFQLLKDLKQLHPDLFLLTVTFWGPSMRQKSSPEGGGPWPARGVIVSWIRRVHLRNTRVIAGSRSATPSAFGALVQTLHPSISQFCCYLSLLQPLYLIPVEKTEGAFLRELGCPQWRGFADYRGIFNQNSPCGISGSQRAEKQRLGLAAEKPMLP